MSQVSAAATDIAGAVVLTGCSVSSLGRRANTWWVAAFGAGAAADVVGAVHHLAFPPVDTMDTGAERSFAAACIALACALAALLAAAATTVLEHVAARIVVALGWTATGLFVLLALLGHGTVGPLVLTQLPTMLGVLLLWGRAARHDVPEARAILGAFAAAACSALAFAPPVKNLGAAAHLDPITWQHVLLLPGMLGLAVILTRSSEGPLVRARLADATIGP